jgi:hypothetical protein
MILAFGVALTASCRGSDQVAPEGSTITLAANPATIPLVSGTGSSDVVATVYSAAGVPQEDQDVRFSSSAGSLFTPDDNQPAANIPIRTDDLGNAHVNLITTTNTTVTARSGPATGTLTLNTVDADFNHLEISLEEGAGCTFPDATLLTCTDTLCLVAKAVKNDTSGLSGVAVHFDMTNVVTTKGDSISPAFSPGQQATTGADGLAHVRFQIGQNICINVCSGGESCQGDLIVELQGDGFQSDPQSFTTNIQ